jgi:hypothetical protein
MAGPVLGEATKIALLRKRVALTHGVPALIVDNLKVINFAFSFVPGTIGVYEGGTEVILKSLGPWCRRRHCARDRT